MSVIVAPNSTIQLLNVVGLDNRYLHTYYFSSVSEQNNYYTARVKTTWGAQSYTRNTSNFIKVQVTPEALEATYNCSYLRFQNTSFGSKWFYAFVTSMDYINNQTIGITFEIDVLQTWLFGNGLAVNPCYVERQTPTAEEDAPTVSHPNCEPEPFNVTNYQYRILGDSDLFDRNGQHHYSVVITSTLPPDYTDTGYYKYGMFTGLGIISKWCDEEVTAKQIAELLNQLTTAEDGTKETERVVSVIMLPSKLAPPETPHPDAPKWEYDFTDKWSNTPNGYACTYNKCLRYPYNYIFVTDHNGTNYNLRKEWFEGNVIKFIGVPSFYGTGEFIFYPYNYKNITDDYNDKIVINNFPQCAYSIDSYRAWIAHGGLATLQTNMENLRLERETAITNAQIGMYTGAGSTATKGLGAAMMGANPGGVALTTSLGILNSVGSYGQTVNSVQTAEQIASNNYEVAISNAMAIPDMPCGSTASNTMSQIRALNAYAYQVFPSYDEFKRLDKFFDVFGYTQNSVRAPIYNPTASANGSHMFVKTKMANVSGAAPAIALSAINKILDSGITFWSSAATAGQYAL